MYMTIERIRVYLICNNILCPFPSIGFESTLNGGFSNGWQIKVTKMS